MTLQRPAPVILRQLIVGEVQSPPKLVEPATFPPPGADVHLWRIRLALPAPILADLANALSPDEQERAGRFIRSADRARFVVCRGALRSILGRYAALPASDCRFDYGPRGKPRLLNSSLDAALQFNVSHSGDWALIAVTQNRPIGVDLEQIRPDGDVLGVGQLAFSVAERERLQSLPEAVRVAAFFDLWTCKEAYLKGIGEGFFGAPQRVTLTPGVHSPASSPGNDQAEAPAPWFVVNLRLMQGYAAAVAVAGESARVYHADWSHEDSSFLS
jgi:4'-phosphopantetheinyl transferase